MYDVRTVGLKGCLEALHILHLWHYKYKNFSLLPFAILCTTVMYYQNFVQGIQMFIWEGRIASGFSAFLLILRTIPYEQQATLTTINVATSITNLIAKNVSQILLWLCNYYVASWNIVNTVLKTSYCYCISRVLKFRSAIAGNKFCFSIECRRCFFFLGSLFFPLRWRLDKCAEGVNKALYLF